MAEEKKKKKKQKKEAVVVNAPQTEVSSATQKPAEDKSKKEVNPNRAIIVANNRPFFENAAQFLDRRGFDTVVVTSLTEVIKLVSEARPKYAFISYNLKNANVKKMEVLLTKTFNLNCIVFPEELGSQVAARLQREGFAHVMQAPVSGPSMYMHIKKMIREEEDAANRKERKKRELNKDWNNHVSDRIQIKKSDLKKHFDENMHGEWSQTTDANGKTVWHFDNGSETSHNGKSGMYTFTGEKPPVRNEKGEWEIPEDGEMQFNEFNESAKSSGIYFQKGLPDQKAGGIYMPSQKSGFDDGNSLNDSENSASDFEISQEKWKGRGSQEFDERSKKKNKFSSGEDSHENSDGEESGDNLSQSNKKKGFDGSIGQEGSESKAFNETSSGPNANSYNQEQEGPETTGYSEKQSGPNTNSFSNQSGSELGNDEDNSGDGAQKKWDATHASSNKENDEASTDAPEDAKDKDPETTEDLENFSVQVNKPEIKPLAEAAALALESVFESDPNVEELDPADPVVKASVFFIANKSFKGLIVLAGPESKISSDETRALIREKLKKYLEKQKISISSFDDASVEINEINLSEWAQKFADFYIEGSDGRDEIIAAFIPSEDILGATKPSPEESMLAIDTLSLSPEYKIGFNLYLYFPVNKKYIWYIGKDQQVTLKQISKLISSKMSFVHIKKEDRQAYFMYCVIAFLDSKMKDPKSLLKNAV